MIIEGQMISVKWNNTNKEWYVSKGYTNRKRYEIFDVPVEDLHHGSQEIIKVMCDYCGCTFESKCRNVFLNRRSIDKDSCPKCKPKKISDGTKQRRAAKNVAKAEKACVANGYQLLTTVNEYHGVKMQARFYCPKHGEQQMMLENIIHGHKCKKCSYEQRGKNLANDIETVVKNIQSIHGNKLLNPEDYKDSVTRNLRIRCACGNEFITSYVNYTKANKVRCSSCAQSISVAEDKIMRFLDAQHIEYIREHRFDDCRDKRTLPFDFYIPSHNLVIEYDGKHHYQPIRGEERLETVISHDKIKDDYCQKMGVDILRIPYWKTKDMLQMIQEKMSA